MKKIVSVLLVFIIILSCASAWAAIDLSDLSFMEDASDQELTDLRDLIDVELKDRKKEAAGETVEATRDNPALIGETVEYNEGNSYGNEYSICVVAVATGSTATAIAKSFYKYNARRVEKGEQWVLALVYMEALASDEEKIELSDYYFEFVSKNGVEYKGTTLSSNPLEVKALYVGSEQYAWVGCVVKEDDSPALTYDRRDGGTAWFSLAERASFSGNEITSEVLDKTSTGDEVIFVQRVLMEMGYYKFAPNGEYDKNTITAVKSFQKTNGLKQSGNVDADTKICLLSNEALPAPAGKK